MKRKNLISILSVCATLLLAAQSADARRMAIDFSPAGGSGNDFSDPAQAGILGIPDDASAEISLGFNIDFGLGPIGSVFINENGIVSFGAALDAPFSGGSLASLVGAPGSGKPLGVIAPYYANLTSVGGDADDTLFTAGDSSGSNQIFWQRGISDLTLNAGDSVYTFDDPVPAFRVTWNGLQGLGEPVFTQLYLYSLGANGTFGVSFAYGSTGGFGDDPFPAQGSVAGYVLGTNSTTSNGPYPIESSDFFARITPDGTTNPPPTPVSEPSMQGLFAGALFAAGLFWLRGRRRTAIRPAHC